VSFLNWKVQEARKARSKKVSPKPQPKSRDPSARGQIPLADKALSKTPLTDSLQGVPHREQFEISDNLITTLRSRRRTQTLSTDYLDEDEDLSLPWQQETTRSTASSQGEPHLSKTKASMENTIETPRSRQTVQVV
jgi:hypothetical protein